MQSPRRVPWPSEGLHVVFLGSVSALRTRAFDIFFDLAGPDRRRYTDLIVDAFHANQKAHRPVSLALEQRRTICEGPSRVRDGCWGRTASSSSMSRGSLSL